MMLGAPLLVVAVFLVPQYLSRRRERRDRERLIQRMRWPQ